MQWFSMTCVSGQFKTRPFEAAPAESSGQKKNHKMWVAVTKNTF